MNIEQILKEASEVAKVAIKEAKPTPVMFGMAKDLTSSEMVPGTEEICEEGVCGYAWIKISGRGKLAKHILEHDMGHKGVYGGVEIFSSSLDGYCGQSLERKEASMEAVSEVFTKHGIKHSVYSRMD